MLWTPTPLQVSAFLGLAQINHLTWGRAGDWLQLKQKSDLPWFPCLCLVPYSSVQFSAQTFHLNGGNSAVLMAECSDSCPNTQGHSDQQLHREPGRHVFNKVWMRTKLMILKIPLQCWNWEFDATAEGTAIPVSNSSSSVFFWQRMKDLPRQILDFPNTQESSLVS